MHSTRLRRSRSVLSFPNLLGRVGTTVKFLPKGLSTRNYSESIALRRVQISRRLWTVGECAGSASWLVDHYFAGGLDGHFHLHEGLARTALRVPRRPISTPHSEVGSFHFLGIGQFPCERERAARVYMGRTVIGSGVKPRMVSSANCSEETRLPIKFKGAHA